MSKAEITEYYKKYLGREPDAAGLEYWLGNLTSGKESLDSIQSNIQISSDAQEYKAAQAAVKPWQQNYDATTSNFEDLNDIKAAESNDPRKVSFENNITGMLEQKGLLADQAQPYIDSAYAQDTTLDALKHTAQQTGTAEDRGDVWGASDDSSGKSFLTGQESSTQAASDNWQTNAEMISKLYTEGFGREADTAGLKYWTEKLTDGSMTYGDIAKSFGVSEEAGIRDAYHQEYGRDADDAGLQYWLAHEDGAAAALATMQDSGTLETELREGYGTHLGQFSKEADRQANIAAGGMWTDVQEGGYKNLDWRDFEQSQLTGKTDAEKIASAKAGVLSDDHIQKDFDQLKYDFGHRSETDMHDDFKLDATGTYSAGDQKTGLAKFQEDILKGETTLEDVKNILERRGDVMTVGAFYDVDDTEGGSGIGRTLTLDEIQPYMSESKDLNEFAANLGEEKWALLTKELYKQPHPELGWGEVTYPKGKGAAGVIANPGVMEGVDVRGTNRNTLSHDYQVPVPPDYQGPDKANVNRQNVDYMPDLDGTVPDRNIRPLDSSYTQAPQQATRKQGAFVAGTSAQGVRRRQSSAARSGRSAMGTKQLARNNMQIKSLNI